MSEMELDSPPSDKTVVPARGRKRRATSPPPPSFPSEDTAQQSGSGDVQYPTLPSLPDEGAAHQDNSLAITPGTRAPTPVPGQESERDDVQHPTLPSLLGEGAERQDSPPNTAGDRRFSMTVLGRVSPSLGPLASFTDSGGGPSRPGSRSPSPRTSGRLPGLWEPTRAPFAEHPVDWRSTHAPETPQNNDTAGEDRTGDKTTSAQGSDTGAAHGQAVPSVSGSETRKPVTPCLLTLPVTVRRMIWKLSSSEARVVILYAYTRPPEAECTRDGIPDQVPFPVLPGPHVLVKVNSESRKVECGSRPFTVQPKTIPNALQNRCWLDPSRDWHLDLRLWYTMNELASVAQNIAIIDRIRSDAQMRWMVRNVFSKVAFPEMKNLAMVRNVITIHAPPKAAWAAGLFHFKDSSTLVDINDTDRIRKFYQFYITTSTNQSSKSIGLFDMLLQSRTNRLYEETAMKEMKDLWFVAQYKMSHPELVLQPAIVKKEKDNPSQPWWDQREWAVDGIFSSAHQTSIKDFVASPGETGELMIQGFPKINFMILFRLCTSNLCATGVTIHD
ncbi:hypothetical protein F5Y12DRAFT_790438 [Xylaria sp. FL1777]|nr:hypothetical protein F5Y12DRAFT_790438 [Xylaria sp. FL1777]